MAKKHLGPKEAQKTLKEKQREKKMRKIEDKITKRKRRA